jgi:hypothetical protein
MTTLQVFAITSGFVLALPGCAQDSPKDLLAAARKGDVETVRALLDNGLDVNSKTESGATALFFACDLGNLDLVKLLLDRGADVNAVDTSYHASALAWAMQKDRLDIMKVLLEHGAKSPGDVLKAGVQNGNRDWIKLALSVRGGVDKASLSIALAAATKAGKDDIAQLLREAGAVMRATPKLDGAVLARYAGTYAGSANGLDLEFVLTVDNGELSGMLKPQPAVAYTPTDATHFLNEQFGVRIVFAIEDGVVTGFKLSQGGVTIDFKRKAESK